LNAVAGVDEAGRGPLAGPVVAAAVILSADDPIEGLADSKRLAAARREQLAGEIRARALAWCVASAGPGEIDRINILQASLVAMARAVRGLGTSPSLVMVDGAHRPVLACACCAVVDGDDLVPQIAAASILAKVTRDAEMQRLAAQYPGYGFEQHKGYPTRAHLQALERLGPTPVHRRSFAPVREVLARERRA